MKKGTIRTAFSYAQIVLGSALMAVGFDWFYAPNGLTCGGFTGISQIIHYFVPALPVGVMIVVLNLPLFVLGLRRFGLRFLFKTIFTTVLSSVLIDVVAAVHTFRAMDPLLCALYGGVVLGAAMGWLLREEATTGGTELAAWLVKAHAQGLSIGKICLVLDLAVILLYAAVFGHIENAFYGGVALYICTTVIDFVVYGANTAKVAYIISDKSDEIMHELLVHGIGATRLEARGGYTNADHPVLLCALRRRDIVAVKRGINELDEHAFFILCDAREVLGNGFGEYDPNGLQ